MEFHKSNFWDDYMDNRVSSWAPLDKINQYANGNVLDIGCGLGDHLAKVNQSDKLYGIDVTDKILERAKKNYPQINFFKANAYNTPFTNNFFELVFSIEVVEHLDNPEKMFKEVQRVLKPGGYFIFQTPNYPVKRIYDLIFFLNGRNKKISDDPTHITKKSSFWWEDLAKRYFIIEEAYARNVLLENKIKWLARLRWGLLGKIFGQKMIFVCKKT